MAIYVSYFEYKVSRCDAGAKLGCGSEARASDRMAVLDLARLPGLGLDLGQAADDLPVGRIGDGDRIGRGLGQPRAGGVSSLKGLAPEQFNSRRIVRTEQPGVARGFLDLRAVCPVEPAHVRYVPGKRR